SRTPFLGGAIGCGRVDVDLDLRLSAARAYDHTRTALEPHTQDVACGERPEALTEVVDPFDTHVADPSRRPLAQRPHDRGQLAPLLEPQRDLGRGEGADTGVELAQPLGDARTGGLQLARHREEVDCGRDAVLIAHLLWVDEIAERLFVAVCEAADPR